MPFAVLLQRFRLFVDPEDHQTWIHDDDDPRRWTKCLIALQLIRAMHHELCMAAYTRGYNSIQTAPPPSGPPPSAPPMRRAGPPPLCQHAASMFNGMPWENQQSIGRDLTSWNWITPDAGKLQSWRQRLFDNNHCSRGLSYPGVFFEEAILQSQTHLEWASMSTHGGRYFGIASKCRACEMICRIAWTSSSTAHHMCTQRAHILSWLDLPYETPTLEDRVPIV